MQVEIEVEGIKISEKTQEFKSEEVYRNIATCDPSQDLYDDLVDPGEEDVLFELEAKYSRVDTSEPGRNRPIQYGNIDDSLACFLPNLFSMGRFSNRTFGVWYGALEEKTSVKEALFHRPEIEPCDLRNAANPIISQRRLFIATVEANEALNLVAHTENVPLLVEPNSSEAYPFCQKLAAEVKDLGVEMLLTPSVRNEGGICVPVFEKECIKSDKILKNINFIFPKDGSEPQVYVRDLGY